MKYLFLLWSLMIIPLNVLATCKFAQREQFYSLINNTNPFQREVEKLKEATQANIELAKQRPNPEVDFDYLKGEQFGQNVSNYGLSIRHIFELGDKREKRVRRAKSFEDLKNKEYNVYLRQRIIDSILSFQRASQLELIIKSVTEAIDTFETVINKLSKRNLNPEEKIALTTIRLAKSDYQSQLNDLENEKLILEGDLQFLTDCKEIHPIYSELKPLQLSSLEPFDSSEGLLAVEQGKLKYAQAEVALEESLGYTNLAIGPSFDFQTQDNSRASSVGISLSFSLPLFHTNNGGKLRAIKKASAKKIQVNNRKKSLMILRDRLRKKYQRSLFTLSSMPSLSELEKEHSRIEKLFARGIVSIQMTIEGHRQQVEFLKSRFETENDILKSLGELSLIEGNFKTFQRLL